MPARAKNGVKCHIVCGLRATILDFRTDRLDLAWVLLSHMYNQVHKSDELGGIWLRAASGSIHREFRPLCGTGFELAL